MITHQLINEVKALENQQRMKLEIAEIRRLMLSDCNPVAVKYFEEKGMEILPSGKIIPKRFPHKHHLHNNYHQKVAPSRLLDLQKSVNARYGHPHILPSFTKKNG